MCHLFSLNLLLFCLFLFFFQSAPGSMIDRVTVFCGSAQELQEWLENLQPFTKGGSPAGTISKVNTRTLSSTYAYSVNPKQQLKWNQQPDMTRCENKTFCMSINLTYCCADCGGEAAQHGRDPYSPLTPGQHQRRQPRTPGATKDQQALVPELPAPRPSPQTLCCAGV